MRRARLLSVLGCMMLAACAGPGGPALTAWPGTEADSAPYRVYDFAHSLEGAFNPFGMAGLRDRAEFCYHRATVPRLRVQALRNCLVYDYTAFRIDGRVRSAQGGHSPYWEREALNKRWGRYGPLAGFETAEAMLAYQRQGSDAVFAELVRLGLPLSWQAGLVPAPRLRVQPGVF